jgi:class 3 adenylate cyclase
VTGPDDRRDGRDRRGPGVWSALAIHATVYLAVNLLLIACWVLFTGGSVSQLPTVLTNLDDARNQAFWPMYVMVFWGTALVIHLGVVVATAPGRRRRRNERKRQQRRRAAVHASVVGVLPDGMLTDAALAGIRLTDGDKAAKQAAKANRKPRAAGSSGSKSSARSAGSARSARSARSAGSGSRSRRDPPKVSTTPGSRSTAARSKVTSEAETAAAEAPSKRARSKRARSPDAVGPEGAPSRASPSRSSPSKASRSKTPPAEGDDITTSSSAPASASGATPSVNAPSQERAPTAGPRPGPSADLAAAPTAPARRWVAVLFTDIVESTTLNESLGDEVWAAVLAEHRALVRQVVADHDGHEVGTQGDGFLLRFASPQDAVRCAAAIQRELTDRRAVDGDGDGDGATLVPSVRMGVHAGEAVHHDGDDLVGRVVNLAARVTDTAAADEILVTEPVADHLAADVVLVDRGLRQLKGFDRPRHLLAVVWQPATEQIDLAEPPTDRTEA